MFHDDSLDLFAFAFLVAQRDRSSRDTSDVRRPPRALRLVISMGREGGRLLLLSLGVGNKIVKENKRKRKRSLP